MVQSNKRRISRINAFSSSLAVLSLHSATESPLANASAYATLNPSLVFRAGMGSSFLTAWLIS